MIPIPPDYDKAQAYDGSPLPQVTPGGHICVIKGARLEKSKNTNKDMLVVAFDIHENGEFDDIYKARFERAKNYRADAKWPGMYYCLIYNNEGGTNPRFKGFIQAVEESNTGYKTPSRVKWLASTSVKKSANSPILLPERSEWSSTVSLPTRSAWRGSTRA